MSRLAREFRRLFLTEPPPGEAPPRVRALVLELARPAQWQPLGEVWRAVQSELGWPAPAIAVNGHDGLQLWFSLADGVPPEHALALLEGLRQRHLTGVPAHRLALLAVPEPPSVPRAVGGQAAWAAFVAADLAPLFEDTPWLDMPPSQEGQADLLSRVASVSPAAWAAALQHLNPTTEALSEPPSPALSAQPLHDRTPTEAAEAAAAEEVARQFPVQVVQDGSAALALRVDAAKALLSGRGGSR